MSQPFEDLLVPKAPQPLPENLWGDRWQFATVSAEELEFRLLEQPIPLRAVLSDALPSQQNLTQTTPIPGVVIEGGRQAISLARWIAEQRPQYLTAMNRELGAILLSTATQAQWIIATYQEEAIRDAAQTFETRKVQSCGIHFLLIQPDDSGTTYSGLWILRDAQPISRPNHHQN